MVIYSQLQTTLSIFLKFSLLLLTNKKASSETQVSPSAPGIALDYKVHVDAGKEFCIYQYIMPGSVLYIQFQVIKGGDDKAGFGVKDPNDQIVLPFEWKQESSYETNSAVGGYYMICIDNTYQKFSAKLVSVYLNSYIAEDWTRYAEELDKLEVSVSNFSTGLQKVESNMVHILQNFHFSRAKESRDFALLEDNNFYVFFWSLVQCAIIISTGAFHVYFIRRLFESPTSGKTKVRL